MLRSVPFSIPGPSDNSPIPAPALVFHTQVPNSSFPAGGKYSKGSIHFSLNSLVMTSLAREAFQANSAFKDTPGAEDLFLYCLDITSRFEGGFDSVNAYDVAGISLGFLQFARPEGGAGRLLELAGRMDLAVLIRQKFGVSDPHSSADAKLARLDEGLIAECVSGISTLEGIKAQFAMAINKNLDGQNYFDKAYQKYAELDIDEPLVSAFLFDVGINRGTGTLSGFSNSVGRDGGAWIAANIPTGLKRPERVTGWNEIVKSNFQDA
jgi:hypothetical protein